VLDGPGRGLLIPDETKPPQRQGLECLLALFLSLILTCLCGALTSQIIGHYSLARGVLRLCWFPQIYTRARYLKAVLLIENPFYIFGAGHVHDPEA
jgi:hypothetical protein